MTNELTTAYNKNSASHIYYFGFILAGLLYAVTGMTFDELSPYFKNDRASTAKGGFRKIRIKANNADLKALLPKALLIGSADLLNDPKWNKGEMFEKIITEMFTTEKWVKDSVPFFLAGDAVINGENVQIKLNGAELTNEKILTRYGFLA
jgi:hypothetical protein